ncbi:hypothetical protein LguiA_001037 [Lonicera macranthoides]
MIWKSLPPFPRLKCSRHLIPDMDNLIPKIFPQAIKSTEILEGDGGVGTIKLITFGEGKFFRSLDCSQYKSVKHRVDAIDEDHLTYIVPSADGGSICNNRNIYQMKGKAHIAEEHIKAEKEKAMGMFKAVESYLHANPHEY